MDSHPCPFALFFAPDAYSLATKIMGRQSAGHSLLRAMSGRAGSGRIHAAGLVPAGEAALREQLRVFGSLAQLHWHSLHTPETLTDIGALYLPAPPMASVAALRNGVRPAAFSCFGVTHTLASEGAMAQLAALTLPPFKNWDALICTSRAARAVFDRIRAETRETFARETGATHFPDVQAPIIPLGVDAHAFAPRVDIRAEMRRTLGLGERDVMLLSAGRLTFHAKFNPVPLYRALAALPGAQRRRVMLVEAGIYPNDGIAQAYRQAQATFLPDVRVETVDGREQNRFNALWQAADIFISLSDNVQETFGLTPLEAMAAGLPVIASDWDGYRDTVRHGQDGFLVPTVMAAAGQGMDIARRYAAGLDHYDMYIGRLSLAAMVDHEALHSALVTLISDSALRARMGASGQRRVRTDFDWSHILDRYAALCGTLAEIRQKAVRDRMETAPNRPDPFALFSSYPTRQLSTRDRIVVPPLAGDELRQCLALKMTNFGFDDAVMPLAVMPHLLHLAAASSPRVGDLIKTAGVEPAVAARGLLWLAKFGLVTIQPASSSSEGASCADMEESETLSP